MNVDVCLIKLLPRDLTRTHFNRLICSLSASASEAKGLAFLGNTHLASTSNKFPLCTKVLKSVAA